MDFPASRGISSGFFAYLRGKGTTSIMNVTSSGRYYDNMTSSSLVSGHTFYTEYNASYGQWILFDFSKGSFDFNGYYISSTVFTEQPSFWRIEASPDNVFWAIADTQSNQETLNSSKIYYINTFKRIKYLKFIQTGYGGTTNNNRKYVYITAFEIFGKYYKMRVPLCTKKIIKNNFISSIFVLILIAK